MYYIAICDDETFTCSAIEQQLLDLSEKANIPMQVDVFIQAMVLLTICAIKFNTTYCFWILNYRI